MTTPHTVKFGLGSLATALGALAPNAGAIVTAVHSGVSSYHTVGWAGLAGVVAVAFHAIRGTQAGKMIENEHLVREVEARIEHYATAAAPLLAAAAPAAEQVVAAVDPAAAPVVAKVVTEAEAVVAD